MEEIFILIDTLYDDGHVQTVFKNKHILPTDKYTDKTVLRITAKKCAWKLF